MTTSKWSPLSLNLGNINSSSRVQTYATNAKNAGYGALMCFNLRTRNDNDPLATFQAISNAVYDGLEVICEDNGGNRARTAGSVASGYTITYDMAR